MGKNNRTNHRIPSALDIPLTMTFTPSSPCDPSSGQPMSFSPAEELIDSDQLHPFSRPTSVPITPHPFNPSHRVHTSNPVNHSARSNINGNANTNTPSSGNNTPTDKYSPTVAPATLPSSTMIEIERILKQDEAIERGFTPPRQAMNSDESDFDWDEDINIDDNGQVKKKKNKVQSRSLWRKLSPFLRMVIMMLAVAPILALPAILTSVFLEVVPLPVYPASGATDDVMQQYSSDIAQYETEEVRKETIVLVFTWLALMWCVICITNWGVDIIPVVIVKLTSLVTSSRLETVKSRLLIFVGTKKYVKWLFAACWATGSFAFLSTVIHPIIKDQNWQPILINVLGAVIAGCALILVEKILLQIISKNFHQIAYADRIKGNKYALQVLDRLRTSRKVHKKMRPTHSRNNTADNGDFMSPFGTGYRSRQHSRSQSFDNNETVNLTETGGSVNSTPLATPTEYSSRQSTQVAPSVRRMQRDSKIGKSNDIFKGVNRALQAVAMADSTPTKDINSTANAKRLAKSLFYNLQGNGEELVVEDFYPYFENEDDAKEAFAIFDKDGNGDISKREIKEKIFYVYKERKDLHTSLRDLSQAVGKLDIIFLTIVTVIWLLIILSIFGTSVVQNMLSIGSFLVALSFVFGNSLKMLFENIVFLFITHPYDSGDLCNIDGNDMYVREVGLNSTMFVTWDGKRMYYPNNVLSQKPIHNVRRSPNMSEKIVLNVDCYTPQSKIFELRARMRDFLSKESKEFLPDMEIQIQEMDVKLKISMVIEHKGNWQDSGRRWARRTKFNFALKDAVEDIGIKYYALPQRLEIMNRDLIDLDDDQAERETLGPNSPLRHYSPDQIAKLYRRKTINRPQGE
ncbi:Mechanosensitive ion channel-domain-containing protein [Dissophora ornata]|nr:Mechanosensitive ion channel-domain-containing protein [Dissophora ornata]